MNQRLKQINFSSFSLLALSALFLGIPLSTQAQEILGIAKDPDPCIDIIGNIVGDAIGQAEGTIEKVIIGVTGLPISPGGGISVHDSKVEAELKRLRTLNCEIKKGNAAVKDKEVGKTIFGVPIPFTSWDSVVINLSKAAIERIVDSTVDYINSGFDDNPAYLTDPGQFFGEIANGEAINFLRSAPTLLGASATTSNRINAGIDAICSPFKAQVRVALQKSFVRATPYQCTLTGVIANIENFYDDFSQGGWEGWFAMTQDNANNPYSSYLEAKVEMDSRIAAAIGIEQQKLSWGNGFLSREECPKGANSTRDSDGLKCTDTNGNEVKKTIITPGKTIESGLENVLGTGIRQLELADEFDELIGALTGQLLQKSIFSIKGLRGTDVKLKGDKRSLTSTIPSGNTGPGSNYGACIASCDAQYCSAPSGDNNESGQICTPPQDYSACLTACAGAVSSNPNNAVSHQVTGTKDPVSGGQIVLITATLPNLPTRTQLVIRVDGTDKFSCTYSPCKYSNSYPDGEYTYDAYYFVGSEQTFLTGGKFTLPVPTTPGGGGGEAKNWTLDQWKNYVFGTLFPSKNIGSGWSTQALNITRADLNALGADWQFTGSGSLRPRIYLPTQYGGPLSGDYSRFVDVAAPYAPEGSAWQWIIY